MTKDIEKLRSTKESDQEKKINKNHKEHDLLSLPRQFNPDFQTPSFRYGHKSQLTM